jgi:hypothetical protein
MHESATATTASSTLPEQSITTSLCFEIMHDLDDGHPALLASTQGNLGDLAEVGPTEAIRRLREARAHLDQAEQLINQYTEAHTLPAFLQVYNVTLVETGLEGFAETNPKLAAGFKAFGALKTDGTLIVVVPEGQPPVDRLAAVRAIVFDLQRRAEQP